MGAVGNGRRGQVKVGGSWASLQGFIGVLAAAIVEGLVGWSWLFEEVVIPNDVSARGMDPGPLGQLVGRWGVGQAGAGAPLRSSPEAHEIGPWFWCLGEGDGLGHSGIAGIALGARMKMACAACARQIESRRVSSSSLLPNRQSRLSSCLPPTTPLLAARSVVVLPAAQFSPCHNLRIRYRQHTQPSTN